MATFICDNVDSVPVGAIFIRTYIDSRGKEFARTGLILMRLKGKQYSDNLLVEPSYDDYVVNVIYHAAVVLPDNSCCVTAWENLERLPGLDGCRNPARGNMFRVFECWGDFAKFLEDKKGEIYAV